ncbi:MAG TPA: hypothetical protein VHY31_15890 [Streptosporangiaceae bacterium]|nr:hypothetical protein [Streptosporangiaceae bacterium]
MRENVVISFRGASYQIGRGRQFYGIWPAGVTQPQPLEWWPVTPEGWSGAWSRFTSLEKPGTIEPVATVAGPGAEPAAGSAASGRSTNAITAVFLLGVGVVCGVVGLFPAYLGGQSLAQQPAEIVPHAIYFAAWLASAALIWLGGTRQRVGALLATGVSAVTFGFFFADAGTPISGGAHLGGAGLVLGLIGWLACAGGSVVAFRLQPIGRPGKPRSDDWGPVVMLMLAAVGTAAAFAPSWDRYVLRVASGASQTITAGNAFANPAAVIAGNVVVMIAVVAVVAIAALWRPIRLGAALLAGAIIPMAAEAISALVQVGEATSPEQFGFSSAQASASGLTISSGVTAAFWIYCAFLVALIASFAWMLVPPHSAVADGSHLPHGDPADATASVTGVAPAPAPGPTSPPSPDAPDTAPPDTAPPASDGVSDGTANVPGTPPPAPPAPHDAEPAPQDPPAPPAPQDQPAPPAPQDAEPGAPEAGPEAAGGSTATTTVAPIVGTVVPRTPSPESADG